MPDVPSPAGAETPMDEASLNDPVKRGFYLATAAHCLLCHTPKGEQDPARAWTGGHSFEGPWGVSVSRNITPRGIGDWSDAEVKAAIARGVRPDGTKLQPPMAYEMYGRMSDADLGAIVAYLRTLPARD
jgi:mono/diheme cytochrome c family protein